MYTKIRYKGNNDMRKIWLVLALAAVLICTLTACGQTAETTSPTATVADEPAIILLDPQGYVDQFGGKNMAIIYQNEPQEVLQKGLHYMFEKRYGLDANINIIYVDSLTDGLLMLRTGKADYLMVMRFTARYLAQRNNDLVIYGSEDTSYSTHIIFNPDKQAQLDKVNAAIKAMREDGTLDKLTQQWITDLPVGDEPAGGIIPVITGAETLKVGISGDEPPLDYIAADGTPGGFNVAALTEIGRRANLNIELIAVNGNARFTALKAGKIDSFLWYANTHVLTAATSYPATPTPAMTVQPSGANFFLQSDSYMLTRAGILGIKK
jgi:ABC-type amino acid transport substrate-binding protein